MSENVRVTTGQGYSLLLGVLSLCGSVFCTGAFAQTGLNISYGNKGVQSIQFNGLTLEDTGQYPADAFHIWHVEASDLNGRAITSGQYGWGELNNGETWDAGSATETYTFSWGSVSTHFVKNGNNLDLLVTETNNSNSGIVLKGVEIFPFALHFPTMPVNFFGYTQNVITSTGPGVSVADYGQGVVTAVIPNEASALYGGWKSQGGSTYAPIMTTAAPDGLAPFLPRNNVPVLPGNSFAYTVSLRFTSEGTAADASDAYSSFASTYPSQLNWTDRRILGTAYLASSPGNADITQPGGFPTNPRRYFNDPSVDITTAPGLQTFQNRILAQAAVNVSTARVLNGQGVITWDLEGEQYPQNTSYVCSPDQIASVAPEMESVITDTNSTYVGMKLDDAYFKIMADAGLRTGVCLRPQAFTLAGNGTASQVFLSGNAAITANLENKARYANSRWGTTVFYVDSTVNPLGGTLDPAIFQQVNTDLPTFLFIPEESTPRYYAYTAPFYSFLFHGDLGTPASTYLFYPKAFGANLINDVSADSLATSTPQLTKSVAGGDILMGHADYLQANDPTLVAIYAAAGQGTKQPVRSTPVLTWNTPATIPYGTALSATQLNASANIPGSFAYMPGPGTLPSVGNTSLLTTFTPLDVVNYKAATAVTQLTVSQAAPVLSWDAPAPILSGTALSSLQLNATANVPGTFTYMPDLGTILPIGTSALRAQFTPTDSANYLSVSQSTMIGVTANQPAIPVVDWSPPASISYGTRLSSAQLNATANVAGSFSYNPPAGTILSAGVQVLQAMFAPLDPAGYQPTGTSTRMLVTQATPNVTWQTPTPIVQGTGLSGAQLNASASVPGTFTYDPQLNTVPAAGNTRLQVAFTPLDTTNYGVQSATVVLTVLAPAPSPPAPPSPAPAGLAVLSPTAGQTVAGSISVVGNVTLNLDPAGTFLIVDGVWLDQHRVTSAPFLYTLDTTTLPNGPHQLQLWAHDIGNNTTISAPVAINVLN